MPYVPRLLEPVVRQATGAFPAVVLTGPRRSGKTSLLRHLFPGADYVLLEDPEVVARVRSDPRGFLDERTLPVIFDEIQHAPELFNHVRARIDYAPSAYGQWLFTGSQEAPLMQGVTESMAGRAAILHLLPLSLAESSKVSVLYGGYPEPALKPQVRSLWFSSFVQSYLERDVRGVTQVRDLITFRRFLALIAARHGQLVNRSDLAAPLGVSIPTIGAWLRVLEVTGQIVRVPPYFESFGKRLVKTPKLYFVDSGLVCHLLGIRSQPELDRSPFLGAIVEGFVASEILKWQDAHGLPHALYFFRDHQGLEVDFLVPIGGGEILLVEVKATRTVTPAGAAPMEVLARAMDRRPTKRVIVHLSAKSKGPTRVVSPGVDAVSLEELPGFLEAIHDR